MSDPTGGGLACIVDLLRCPHCRQPLTLSGPALRCPAGHSFDVARQGYVNLLAGRAPRANADSAAMVQARDRFLTAGHYHGLTEAIADLAGPALDESTCDESTCDESTRDESTRDPVILEAGAGTGHYLARLLDRLPTARGIATDLSVAACRRAARAHPRLGAVVADTWAGLPVADGCLDLVLVVFAPQNVTDFVRMLRPGGLLLVAAPTSQHLSGIREPLGLLEVRTDKQRRLTEVLGDRFEPVATTAVAEELLLTAADLIDLVSMGPNAHHQDAELRQRIEQLAPPRQVSCAVGLSLFRRRPG